MLTAIIVAAGSSKRAGFDKLAAKIAGRPVIQHTLAAFEKAICVNDVLVVSRETVAMRHFIVKTNLRKIRRVVRGGARRQDSVQAGLNALDNEVEFVDLRFADMLGKQHHVSFPAHAVDESIFEDGKMFDGSSIAGWKASRHW